MCLYISTAYGVSKRLIFEYKYHNPALRLRPDRNLEEYRTLSTNLCKPASVHGQLRHYSQLASSTQLTLRTLFIKHFNCPGKQSSTVEYSGKHPAILMLSIAICAPGNVGEVIKMPGSTSKTILNSCWTRPTEKECSDHL